MKKKKKEEITLTNQDTEYYQLDPENIYLYDFNPLWENVSIYGALDEEYHEYNEYDSNYYELPEYCIKKTKLLFARMIMKMMKMMTTMMRMIISLFVI